MCPRNSFRACLLIFTLVSCAVAQATPIGNAHREIHAQYKPYGFAHFQFQRCQTRRGTTECVLWLTSPVKQCQEVFDPVIGPRGLCSNPPSDMTGRSIVRVRGIQVREVARWTTLHGQTEKVFP